MTTLQRTFVLSGDTAANSLWAFLKSNWRVMAEQGKALAVVVTPYRAKRTNDQNAKLHAVLNDIAEQAWVGGKQYPMAAWKEHYREKFVGVEVMELPNGETRKQGRSTTELNVEEMAELITRIQADAAMEYGVETL